MLKHTAGPPTLGSALGWYLQQQALNGPQGWYGLPHQEDPAEDGPDQKEAQTQDCSSKSHNHPNTTSAFRV